MLSDGRRVVDSFLVSEPHEAEILLAKLHAGGDVVDEFVAIEGAYTFRGEWKGLWLKRSLRDDARFVPFRDRVMVIECVDNLLGGRSPCEAHYFEVEFASRELSRPYIESRYGDHDLVTCSDVDEMLDFSEPRRARELDRFLVQCASAHKIAYVQMLKFWYDFDNRSDERKWFPLGPLSVVRDCWRQRQAPDHLVRLYRAEPDYAAFEYSFCFPREAVMRKLCTFSHDGYTQKDVDDALAGNYWVKCSAKGQRRGERHDENFRTVSLDESNSTFYVRENLARLKTHNVGPT